MVIEMQHAKIGRREGAYRMLNHQKCRAQVYKELQLFEVLALVTVSRSIVAKSVSLKLPLSNSLALLRIAKISNDWQLISWQRMMCSCFSRMFLGIDKMDRLISMQAMLVSFSSNLKALIGSCENYVVHLMPWFVP